MLVRRLPIGAEPLPEGGVHFRVWAPARRSVSVVLEGGGETALEREDLGYFSGCVAAARAGSRYRYRLDGGDAFPDPASRFQPEGPHGPSEVIDPGAFRWNDTAWKGIRLEGQVLYEMHIGAFTPEGAWESAARELPELARIGITVIEVMPVAEFAGTFGWGYDGVDLFAPTRLYGAPDDFRRFVDRAHGLGLGVILDVVYNHFGPDGNYAGQFSQDYFTSRYETDWGEAINFDGENAGPVREFVTANAGYWIEEYHLDGLRLDATQTVHDFGAGEHILAAISHRAREAARGRSIILVAENELQYSRLARPHEEGGFGLDALWNDDFHHSAMVAMTGRNEAYYTDYLGTPQELISAMKHGYLYQGQWHTWQEQCRGFPALDLSPATFVTFLQNHDQIANSGQGLRCHLLTSPGRYRALTALLLLGPGTPMLFQGQEFGASSPFLFFADHTPELAELVRKGRREFLAQWPSLALPEMVHCLADPGSRETFERSKLDFREREKHAGIYALHCDLLKLRREDPVFRSQRPRGLDGAVLAGEALALRCFGDNGDDRLMLLNLGRDLQLMPAPEPLLAPPSGAEWTLLWSSEDVKYGGCGTMEIGVGPKWRIPGHAAVVLKPRPAPERLRIPLPKRTRKP